MSTGNRKDAAMRKSKDWFEGYYAGRQSAFQDEAEALARAGDREGELLVRALMTIEYLLNEGAPDPHPGMCLLARQDASQAI